MRRIKILAVVCVSLFVAATGSQAQTAQHLKDWGNLTNPGGTVRVGDTIRFTIDIVHVCDPSCDMLVVDLRDEIEPGLLLLDVGDDCAITASGFQCILDGLCYDIEPTYLRTSFRVRVLATGQHCNQSFATPYCSPAPPGPQSASNVSCFTAEAAEENEENIDPDGDGSQYAWAENVGWINAEPLGHGGPGVQVDDFELTGYMWGENVGWVNLSCKNGSTCGTTDYGVVNDGAGLLSGYAWSENVGWIHFAPATAGVVIDVATGEFSGEAWAENVGWIRFASSGPNPFKVKTGWNCFPAPPVPPGSSGLVIGKSGTDAELSWDTVFLATGYDILKGDLGTLRDSGGDFSQATDACLSNHLTTTSMTHSGTPNPGGGIWYLMRGENCGGKGTCDSDGVEQVGRRDAEIAASGNDCP